MKIDPKEVRKELHRIPEIAYQEFKTDKYLLKLLSSFSGLKIHRFDFPGILAEYTVNDGDYMLFRADMDALPIEEKTGCDFSSQHPGFMHACGHDMHMAILVGLIQKVVENQPKRNLLFLFQPAEEGKGGAKKVLETGILDQFGIESAWALHVRGDLPVGKISTCPGIFFANTEEIDVEFFGKSAHVAYPEQGCDALAAGCEFYYLLKQEFEKEHFISSYMCRFGRINSGVIRNVIADHCKLEGTLRAFNYEDKSMLEGIVKETMEHTGAQFGVKTKLTIMNAYDAVSNDPELYEKIAALAGKDRLVEAEPVLTGEDFGFFTNKYKGLLFWLGAGVDMSLHSPYFLPDEEAIEVGIEFFYRIATS